MRLDRSASVLVTGAGGVLGRALQAHLSDQGFDNVHCPSRRDVDLLDADATDAYFDRVRPQVVFHLASVVFGLVGNMRNQFRSLADNTRLNSNVLGALEARDIQQVFFAGTVASYSYPYRSLPLTEDQFFSGLPHYGEFGYANAKRHAYAYLRILAEEKGLRYAYGIFTNLYGPHDKFDIENGHVIPSLIAKAHTAAQTKTPLHVWGNGQAERDFLHAEDAARAALFCLDNGVSGLVNISSGQGASIRHVAETVAAAAGIAEVVFQADAPVGVASRVVDNSQLVKAGFVAGKTLEEGLAETYRWYVDNFEEVRR